MWDLFNSEFKRYRVAAILILVGQLLLWMLYSRFDLVLIPRSEKHAYLVFSCVFAGLLFAAISIGLHKRKNSWTYLIHRPLTCTRIHQALSAAGLALLFIGFVLPFLLVLIYMDLFTNSIVELRHYIYMLHLMMITSVAYFLGQFAMLSPNRLLFAAVWVLTYLIISNQEPLSYFAAIDLLFLAIAVYLAHRSFKVNLNAYSEDKGAIVLSALVLQPALLIGLLSLQAFYYHIPLNIIGSHPDQVQLAQGQTSGYRQFIRQEIPDMYQQILAESSTPIAKSLSRQVTLAEFNDFSGARYRAPQKGGLFMHDSSQHFMLADGQNATWFFSHNDMMFVGYNNISNDIIGYLGPQKFVASRKEITPQNQFKEVAIGINQNYIQTKGAIYRVDFEHKRIDVKHKITANDEYYTTTIKPMFDVVAVQSNKASYFFNQISFTDSFTLEIPEHVALHPTAISYKLDVTITQVTDGYLAMYVSHHLLGTDKGGAALVYLPYDGESQVVGTLAFRQTLPDLISYQRIMFSPIILNLIDSSLNSVVHFADDLPKGHGYFWHRSLPSSVIAFCVVVALCSAITVYVLASKSTVKKTNKYLWTAIALLFGLPGLLAFLMMSPWRQKPSHQPMQATNKELVNV